jgi:hypothetical protein
MATDGEGWDLFALLSKHTGVNESGAAFMCSAASVCLKRHHAPPTVLCVSVNSDEKTHALSWQLPTPRDYNANNNRADAARDGAYAVALVCVERRLNLYAICRAEERTGADWYVAPPGYASDTELPNVDDPVVMRLEVGGYDKRSLPGQLTKKVEQIKEGESVAVGIAAVVGFQQARVMIKAAIAPGVHGGRRT